MRTTALRLALLAIALSAAPLRAEDAPPPAPPLIPTFTDESATAGIDSVYKGEWEYMVGGGAAAFDCNGDGFDDVLLAGGELPAKFYRNASAKGGALKFVA